MANPINWFEIPTKDLDKAVAFYSEVFGVAFERMEMGPLNMAMFAGSDREKHGATGALVEAEGYVPSANGSVVYFSCDDVEAALKNVEKAGGKTIQSKTSIGEHGFIAHFLDPEGNHVALHSVQ